MKVLVTGGSGKVGRWVIRDLIDHGYEVVNADLRPLVIETFEEELAATGQARYHEVDLTDVGQVSGALAGCEAVVHLGGIPDPTRHPPEVVFGTNVRATFAVLQAAMLSGVRKAVTASSLASLGLAFAPRPFPPLYAPVDEEHPLLGQDSYALSKEVDERTCAMFHRRTGMSVLAYRFHMVTDPGEAATIAADVRAHPERMAHLLWGYVDARDVARACRLGVETEGLGCEVFNITASDTLSETDTEDLIHNHHPRMELRGRIEGTGSGFHIEKARRLLGYIPHHSWRKEVVHEDSLAR